MEQVQQQQPQPQDPKVNVRFIDRESHRQYVKCFEKIPTIQEMLAFINCTFGAGQWKLTVMQDGLETPFFNDEMFRDLFTAGVVQSAAVKLYVDRQAPTQSAKPSWILFSHLGRKEINNLAALLQLILGKVKPGR